MLIGVLFQTSLKVGGLYYIWLITFEIIYG